ncbi:EpsG family protein [Photobacterium angustum]|uniref:EpsG family protein n=1 Tax=Photobacterium angustum TaxID=661 RepID=UPI0018B0B0F6
MGYGTDWIYYNIKFDNISLNNMFNFEFLYSFINYIIKSIGLSYQWVHIVTVAISITFLYLYCTKFNNKNLIFIIAVSFFGIMLFLSQERQGVAVCIFLYSTTINNKFKRNILIILACLFHFSAIFSYVYFYISKRKNFKLFKSIVFFNIFILSFFLFSSFKLFSYIPFIPDFLINKIDIYMGYENLFNFNFSMGYVLNFFNFSICFNYLFR